MSDKLKVTGSVRLVLRGADGKVKKVVERANLVTTGGKTLLAALIGQGSSAFPSHMAIGTSATAAAAAQSALQGAELARQALDSSANVANVLNLVATFGAGIGTGSIEEAGIFNAASSGTMLARFLTGTISKGASDSLEITWSLTFG